MNQYPDSIKMVTKASNGNYLGLDALRGVLAIVVCFAHAWQTFIAPIEGSSTVSGYLFGLSARFAVLWFFCLSGYVIALSVKKNIERFGDFNLWEYFLARAFRILPPLLFVIALVYIIAQLAAVFGVSTLPGGIQSAREVYQTNVKAQLQCLKTLCADGDLTGVLNGPLWSLHFEIQLYTITGLASAVLFFKRYWLVRVLAAVVLWVYLKDALHLLKSPAFSMQIVWFALFYSGASALSLFNHISNAKLWVAAFAGILLCCALLGTYDQARLMTELDVAPRLIGAQLAFGFSCSALIVLASRLKVSQRLADLGKCSYTLYIVHFPLLLIVYFVLINNIGGYPVSMAWAVALTAAVGCIFLARSISGVIENAFGQRAACRKILRIVPIKYVKGASK